MNASNRLLIAVLALLLIGSAGQYWFTQQALNESQREVARLQQQVLTMDAELTTLQQQVAQLSKNSVGGIVREANSALLQGWESLVSTVETELVKAREEMNSRYPQDPAAQGSSAPAPTPTPAPTATP